jgi:hypothetical protein
MLIVDTLPQFAGLKAEAENDSGAALEAMAPLQAAAERGLAVLLTRHDRKGGGEVGESARGSTAWTGAVDTVINLTRDAGRATVRKMATISRFDAAPEELMIELVDGEYVAHGSEAAYAVALAKVAILALPFDEPMRREAIAQAVAKPEATVRRALDELIFEAVLTRSGDGKRGSPFVFARSSDSFPAP